VTIVDMVVSGGLGMVGFDAGDQRRRATIRATEGNNRPLQNLNLFRVDGNIVIIM